MTEHEFEDKPWGPFYVNKKRFREIAKEQRAKENGYTPFSKKEEDELVKWAKESGTAPDLEPWYGQKHRKEKGVPTPGVRNPLRGPIIPWHAKIVCFIVGHKWETLFAFDGAECQRCFKFKDGSELLEESYSKSRWWHRWTR